MMNTTETIIPKILPITLNECWSHTNKLVIFIILSAMGCFGNVLVISSIITDDHLRRTGNGLIANIAIADLILSGFIFPTSALKIFGFYSDDLPICKAEWFVALMNFYVIMILQMIIAMYGNSKIEHANDNPKFKCGAYRGANFSKSIATSNAISVLLGSVWISAALISYYQISFDVGFDYCTRKHSGELAFKYCIGILLIAVPVTCTIICYAKAIHRVSSSSKKNHLKRSTSFVDEFNLLKGNLCCFVLFIIFWAPLVGFLTLYRFEDISDARLYYSAWFGFIKSCINPYFYCVTNRYFRESFIKLTKYCCCKSNVAVLRRQRNHIKIKLVPINSNSIKHLTIEN